MSLAITFTAVLGLLALFQLALAFGAPWGRFSWGGQHAGALPVGNRIASAMTLPVYGLFAVLALDLRGVIDAVPNGASQVGMWVAFALLIPGVAMNALSRSRSERFTMTPVALVLAVLAFFIALAGPTPLSFAGTVLDDGARGPVFCTLVMESYPPQCGRGSPAVVGWDWDAVEHERSESVRWGSYRFDGVRDGGTITLVGHAEGLQS